MKQRRWIRRGRKAIVSGSGNVAIYAAEKALGNGIQVIAMSDSNGYILSIEQLDLSCCEANQGTAAAPRSEYPEMAGHGGIS